MREAAQKQTDKKKLKPKKLPRIQKQTMQKKSSTRIQKKENFQIPGIMPLEPDYIKRR